MDITSYLLGKKSGGGGAEEYFSMYIKNGNSSSSGALILLLKTPENLKLAPGVTSLGYAFGSCSYLEEIGWFDTSKIEGMGYMCNGCSALKTVPILDTSKVTTLQNAFKNCYNLSKESLDNILVMCIGVASNYSRTKTLADIGLTSMTYPASFIQSLPHYQDFIDAGWTIGY